MNDYSRWKQKFLTIAAGQTVSLIGSSAVQFSLIWWLASETGSPMMMALSGLVAFLPQIFLGPFAGVWIDRLKRKHVAIAADMFIGLIAVVFAVLLWVGHPPYWSACAVLGIRALGSVFHTPAIQSIVPQLVPPDKLVRANGWNQFMQSGAFMLGPVIGAAMYAALPLPVILLTDFIGACAASLTMAVVTIPEPEHSHQEAPHLIREMKEGLSICMSDRRLMKLTAAAAVTMVFYLPLASYYPLMSSTYFKASAWHGSAVEFLYALGMMVSAIIFGSLGKVNNKLKASYLGLAGSGITCFICGILPSDMWAWYVFAATCMFMGGAGSAYNIPFVAYLQETIPAKAQGRAFSLLGSIMSLAMPVGLLISSPVAQIFGVNMWFLVSGIGILAVVAVCWLSGND